MKTALDTCKLVLDIIKPLVLEGFNPDNIYLFDAPINTRNNYISVNCIAKISPETLYYYLVNINIYADKIGGLHDINLIYNAYTLIKEALEIKQTTGRLKYYYFDFVKDANPPISQPENNNKSFFNISFNATNTKE